MTLSLALSFGFFVISLSLMAQGEYSQAYWFVIAAVYFRIPAEPVITKEVK